MVIHRNRSRQRKVLREETNEWKHLNNEDVISMPDKWEYPWYAAWDLAFHCMNLPLLTLFAKKQLGFAHERLVYASERPVSRL